MQLGVSRSKCRDGLHEGDTVNRLTATSTFRRTGGSIAESTDTELALCVAPSTASTVSMRNDALGPALTAEGGGGGTAGAGSAVPETPRRATSNGAAQRYGSPFME